MGPNYTEKRSAPTQSCHLSTVPHPSPGRQEAQQDRRGPQQASQQHLRHRRERDHREQGQCALSDCIFVINIVIDVFPGFEPD